MERSRHFAGDNRHMEVDNNACHSGRDVAEPQARAADGGTLAEGLAKGRVETDALWRAWNGRRLDAVAKGEPFDEPPPDIAEPSGNGR